MVGTLGALAAGGIVGTCARGVANRLFQTPLNTLCVNLFGCFLIGLFDAALIRRGASAHWRLLLITGFCGAFTTFSALIFELDALWKQAPSRALAYLLVSVGGGLAFLRAGAALGR
jgi:CrcB protein